MRKLIWSVNVLNGASVGWRRSAVLPPNELSGYPAPTVNANDEPAHHTARAQRGSNRYPVSMTGAMCTMHTRMHMQGAKVCFKHELHSFIQDTRPH